MSLADWNTRILANKENNCTHCQCNRYFAIIDLGKIENIFEPFNESLMCSCYVNLSSR